METVIEIKEDGRKFGWLGIKCEKCNGSGEVYLDWKDNEGRCPDCAGTGEAYGEIKEKDFKKS